jgi:peptidylprolyl isomerase
VALGVSSSAFCLQAALDAFTGGLPPEEKPKLCDDACVKELENVCSPWQILAHRENPTVLFM